MRKIPTTKELDQLIKLRSMHNTDAVLHAQQISINLLRAKLEKSAQLRDVDKWLTLNKDAARLIDRLKELGLAEPIEIGYNILLQPGTFAQMLYDVGFKNWVQVQQYFTIQGKARTPESLRVATTKPDSLEYRKLKHLIR